MDKSTAILIIYDTLMSQKPLTISELSEACDCSRRTSLRYVKNVRKYLLQYHNLAVVFDRKKKTFLIKSTSEQKKDTPEEN